MSVDREYRIRISTITETTGLQDAESGLKKVGGAAEEAHHGFVHAESSGKAFHKLLHGLTEESPLLGAALRVALNPVSGALMAAAWGFREIIRLEEESKKAAEESAEAMGHSVGNMKESIREASEEIARANREFENWQKSFQSVTEATKTALDEELEKLHEQHAVNQELLAQQKELALAKVREKAATGGISQEEATIKEAEIERQFAHTSSADKMAALQEELQARNKALADAVGKGVAASQAVDQAEAAATDKTREAALKDLPKRIAALSKLAGGESSDDQSAALRKAQDALDAATTSWRKRYYLDDASRWQLSPEQIKQFEGEVPKQPEVANAQARVDALKGYQAELAKNKTRLDELNTEQAKANDTLAQAKKNVSELRAEIDGLNHALASTRIQLSIRGPAAAQSLALGDQAAGAQAFTKGAGSDWGKMLYDPASGGGAAHAAWEVMHGQQPGQVEGAQLDSLMRFLGANLSNGGAILQTLAAAVDSLAGQAAAIKMLQQRMQQIQQNTNTRILPGAG